MNYEDSSPYRSIVLTTFSRQIHDVCFKAPTHGGIHLRPKHLDSFHMSSTCINFFLLVSPC